MINSLSISNFRAFEELEVPTFGQLNLIGGSNSAGKTSLLEAIYILRSPRPNRALFNILEAREERRHGAASVSALFNESIAGDDAAVRVLSFFNRSPKPIGSEFQIRSDQEALRCVLDLKRVSRVEETFGEPIGPEVVSSEVALLLSLYRDSERLEVYDDRRFAQSGGTSVNAFRTIQAAARDPLVGFVGSKGLSHFEMVPLWDKVDLTPLKDRVLSFLRLIHPNVIDLAFPSSGLSGNRERLPVVRLTDSDSPVSLNRLGEGSVRLLGLALGAMTADTEVLLIDEIENGLHHEIHFDLWKSLALLARETGVQIFATTHSRDMVTAFRVACATDDAVEGVYLKLLKRNGKHRAIPFDEAELVEADLAGVELR